MVPAVFLILPSLPLLPNGKIDLNALRDLNRPEVADHGAESCTSTEARILQVWREVLQIDHVGTHDNFFDVGGHSLLLAAVQTKLSVAFNREIASVDLYQYPTISALAKSLDGSDAGQRPLESVLERARKRKDTVLRRRAITLARPT
jgi:hypothetical protein